MDFGSEPERTNPCPLLDDFLYSVKSSSAYEQYVGGVYLNKLLMRMLSSALRRY